MSLCYDFQKWTIISLALVAITLTIGLVSLAYGQNFQHPDDPNTPYFNESAFSEWFKNRIESAIYNKTGLHVDLDGNYTQQEKVAIGTGLFLSFCENKGNYTGIDPEKCDKGMKELKARDLIK